MLPFEHEYVTRFLRYVMIDTRSKLMGPKEKGVSSQGQIALAKEVVAFLSVFDAEVNIFQFNESDGLVICQIPPTLGKRKTPHLCLSAHLDTYHELSGKVNPQVHYYEGGDILLPQNNVVIPASDLEGLEGQYIVSSDGSSLLGADDKAGLVGILEAIRIVFSENFPHGQITLLFFPDKETGGFNPKDLPVDLVKKWDVFWTIDGLRLGEIDIGSFICNELIITFEGFDAHPGVAGKNLIPAQYGAAEFIYKLEKLLTPWQTSGKQPYQYATNIEGNASQTIVRCIPRSFEKREALGLIIQALRLAERIAQKRQLKVSKEVKELCGSIEKAISKNEWVLKPAEAALEKSGFEAIPNYTRGGTDGAMLNLLFPKLPAPNLGNGARNIHQLNEFIPVNEIIALPRVIADMIYNYSLIER